MCVLEGTFRVRSGKNLHAIEDDGGPGLVRERDGPGMARERVGPGMVTFDARGQ